MMLCSLLYLAVSGCLLAVNSATNSNLVGIPDQSPLYNLIYQAPQYPPTLDSLKVDSYPTYSGRNGRLELEKGNQEVFRPTEEVPVVVEPQIKPLECSGEECSLEVQARTSPIEIEIPDYDPVYKVEPVKIIEMTPKDDLTSSTPAKSTQVTPDPKVTPKPTSTQSMLTSTIGYAYQPPRPQMAHPNANYVSMAARYRERTFSDLFSLDWIGNMISEPFQTPKARAVMSEMHEFAGNLFFALYEVIDMPMIRSMVDLYFDSGKAQARIIPGEDDHYVSPDEGTRRFVTTFAGAVLDKEECRDRLMCKLGEILGGMKFKKLLLVLLDRAIPNDWSLARTGIYNLKLGSTFDNSCAKMLCDDTRPSILK